MPVVGSPAATQAVSDIVEETRRYLLGSSTGGDINVLGTSITASDTAVVFEDGVTGIGRGTIIEIGMEQMFVRAVDDNTNTLTVLRGHGSTPVTAHESGDLVRVAPSYHAHDIFKAVVDEFASLNGTGLVQFFTCEFSYNGTDTLYDTGLDVASVEPLFVQEAKYEETQTVSRWRPARVELVKGLDVDDYGSGFAFRVMDRPRSVTRGEGVSVSGLTLVRVTVATTFPVPNSFTASVDDDVLGIDQTMRPIVAVGAAWRMLMGKEAQRLNPDVSHGSRRAEEVAPGSISFLARSLQGMKKDLIASALEKQVAMYPPRQNL